MNINLPSLSLQVIGLFYSCFCPERVEGFIRLRQKHPWFMLKCKNEVWKKAILKDFEMKNIVTYPVNQGF